MHTIIALLGLGLLIMGALALAQCALIAAIGIVTLIVTLPIHIAKWLAGK